MEPTNEVLCCQKISPLLCRNFPPGGGILSLDAPDVEVLTDVKILSTVEVDIFGIVEGPRDDHQGRGNQPGKFGLELCRKNGWRS